MSLMLLWRWIAGSKLGQAAAAIFAVLVAVLFMRQSAYQKGKKEERYEAIGKDLQSAKSIQRRVDEVKKKSNTNPSTSNDRLRQHGKLRD